MSGLYVRARDVRMLLAKSLFPPEPRWDAAVDWRSYTVSHDAWSENTAPWDAMRDLVLRECRRFPSCAEVMFRAFLLVPAFASEDEERAWREAQPLVRAAVARSAKMERGREKARKAAKRARAAARALRRCTCQHCPEHTGWAKATRRRLLAAAGKVRG